MVSSSCNLSTLMCNTLLDSPFLVKASSPPSCYTLRHCSYELHHVPALRTFEGLLCPTTLLSFASRSRLCGCACRRVWLESQCCETSGATVRASSCGRHRTIWDACRPSLALIAAATNAQVLVADADIQVTHPTMQGRHAYGRALRRGEQLGRQVPTSSLGRALSQIQFCNSCGR
jgi:hypothetical protein